MAPRLFPKWFKRKEPKPEKRLNHLQRSNYPNAVGINESTCEINGSLFDRENLPVPSPDEQKRQLGTCPCNTQPQSKFFQLPLEIREMIYRELLGDRRVHIGYLFDPPYTYQDHKRYRDQWHWWHRVCDKSHSFGVDLFRDPCWAPCDDKERQAGWTTSPPGTKLQGVELLRCCQKGSVIPNCLFCDHRPILTQNSYGEVLPILYGTNTFVPGNTFRRGNDLDAPFHLSRLLRPDYRSLVTSMDVTLEANEYLFHPPYKMPEAWTATWPAFFDLFHHAFPNIRRLRLTLRIQTKMTMPKSLDKNMDILLFPWETLAASRDWTFLNLCVTSKVHYIFEEKAKAQKNWTLSKTDWGIDFGGYRDSPR